MEQINNFRNQINSYNHSLSALAEAELHQKPAINKWSKKEILGHLCDSAINNYYRFLHLQQSKGLFEVVQYDQDSWVKMGRYQTRDWATILNLWETLNFSIIEILESSFEANKNQQIIIDGVEQDYKFLVQDYYEHLAHHMKQIIN